MQSIMMMKKFTPVLLCAAAMFLYACVSKNGPNFIAVQPAMAGLNNGQNWEVTLTDTIQADSILLHGRSKLNLLRMKLPETTTNNVLLNDNTAQYYVYTTNGSIAQNFKLDPAYNNIGSVTVNTTTRAITGAFKARFIINLNAINPDTTGVDTVTITNGAYQIPLPTN
jgi:hypothetical protein